MVKKRNIKVKLSAPDTDDLSSTKDFGTLRLTTVQLPEIQNWTNGKEYDLTIKVRQVGSREEQDREYSEEKGESIAKGKPYNENEFKIIAVSTPKKLEVKS